MSDTPIYAQLVIETLARQIPTMPQRYIMGVQPGEAAWRELGRAASPIFVKHRPEKYTADWDLLPDGTLKPLSWRAITASMEFEYQDREAFDRLVQIVYGGWPRRTGA